MSLDKFCGPQIETSQASYTTAANALNLVLKPLGRPPIITVIHAIQDTYKLYDLWKSYGDRINRITVFLLIKKKLDNMGKLEKTVISVLFWCWKQEMHIRVNIKFAFSFDHSYHPKNMHNNSISLQLLLHHYLTKLLQRVDYIQYYYHLSKITHPCHPLQLRRVEKQTDSFNTI